MSIEILSYKYREIRLAKLRNPLSFFKTNISKIHGQHNLLTKRVEFPFELI